MAGVYQGSLCNIAAAASRSSDGGCFRARDPTILPLCTFTTDYNKPELNGEYIIRHSGSDSRYYHENQEPLFQRAWVYQERILTPRMLGFASDYAFWHCRKIHASEKNPDGSLLENMNDNIAVSTLLFDNHRDERLIWWNRALSSYSSLGLTKASDKLVAISAIAKRLQEQDMSDKYIAGLVSKSYPYPYTSTCDGMYSSRQPRGVVSRFPKCAENVSDVRYCSATKASEPPKPSLLPLNPFCFLSQPGVTSFSGKRISFMAPCFTAPLLSLSILRPSLPRNLENQKRLDPSPTALLP